jgi:D-amino peptidase
VKVLISADMEGISGVVASEHVSPGHAEYARFRKLMTADVNAAIEGALAGGADEIIVNDSHGPMTNILIEELNPAAELISGSPKPFGMMQGIAPDIDLVFFVGYHAASGTGEAVLEHTWSGRHLFSLQLNGIQVGETGLNAALAGAHDVPVVLVTGDQAVVGEATSLLGEIETVQVKQGITRTAARCLHPQVAHELIREAARRAMSRSVEPFVLQEPVTVQVTFPRSLNADMAELVPGSTRVDGRTVEWTGEEMPDVYRAFRAMVTLASQA